MNLIFDIETEPYPANVLESMGADPEQCCLNASTSCVCAVGMQRVDNQYSQTAPVRILGCPGEVEVVSRDGFSTWRSKTVSEASVLADFWEELKSSADFREVKSSASHASHSGYIVGYNSHGFDLPFLIQRSMLCGVAWPRSIRRSWRWWHDCSVDLREVWACGPPQRHRREEGDSNAEPVFPRGGLDRLSRILGLGGKNGDGTMFWRLFRSTQEDAQQKAMEYLFNDIELTRGVAEHLLTT